MWFDSRPLGARGARDSMPGPAPLSEPVRALAQASCERCARSTHGVLAPVGPSDAMRQAGVVPRTDRQIANTLARFGSARVPESRSWRPEARIDVAAAAVSPEYRAKCMTTGAQFAAFRAAAAVFPSGSVELDAVESFFIYRVEELREMPEHLGKALSRLRAWAAIVGEVWGLDRDPAAQPELNRVMKGLIKMYPKQNARGQKLPLQFLPLGRIRSVLDRIASAHERATLWLQLVVGHQGMLRCNEMLLLEWRDVEFITDVDAPAPGLGVGVGVRLTIRTSKTGAGQKAFQTVLLSRRADEFDTVALLWAGFVGGGRGRPTAPVFTETGGAAVGRNRYIARVRAMLLACGIANALDYAGHSLRAGGATDAFDAGVPLDVVIHQGRWRSDAWKGYRRGTLFMVTRLAGMRPTAALAVMRFGGAAARPAAGAYPAPDPSPLPAVEKTAPATAQPVVGTGTRPEALDAPLRVGGQVTVGASSPFVGTISAAFQRQGAPWFRITFAGSAPEERAATELVAFGGRRASVAVRRLIAEP